MIRLLMVFRACLVMAQLLEDSSFCEEFIQQCPAAVEVLNLVAQECSPGEHTYHFSTQPFIYSIMHLVCNEFFAVVSHITSYVTPCRGASWYG